MSNSPSMAPCYEICRGHLSLASTSVLNMWGSSLTCFYFCSPIPPMKYVGVISHLLLLLFPNCTS